MLYICALLQVMDMCNITYPDESFDVVLEKGTIDALMVHERDPWNISQQTLDMVDRALLQVVIVQGAVINCGTCFYTPE